jgi:hypothetical protein
MVESEIAYKRRVYDTLRVLESKRPVSRSLRIIIMSPSINWHLMLGNLPQAVASDAVSSVWHMMVHDLMATNVRLHNSHIMTTDACLKFGTTYTLMHSLTECGADVDIWAWTTARLAMIHHATPRRNSREWLFCPAFKIWPRP